MEISVKQENEVVRSAWEGVEQFEPLYKVAKMFANSTLLPKHIRGNNKEEGLANMMIVADMSTRTGLPIMATAQNLYIVNGNPSWSSQFIITIINNSKRFKGMLKFKINGKGDTLSCYAYATDLEGKEVVGPTITMDMAKAEGWVSKNGSKWKTMPEVMIQYRAASFFGRMYCSDLLMGLYADEEAQTIEVKQKHDVPNPFEVNNAE